MLRVKPYSFWSTWSSFNAWKFQELSAGVIGSMSPTFSAPMALAAAEPVAVAVTVDVTVPPATVDVTVVGAAIGGYRNAYPETPRRMMMITTRMAVSDEIPLFFSFIPFVD